MTLKSAGMQPGRLFTCGYIKPNAQDIYLAVALLKYLSKNRKLVAKEIVSRTFFPVLMMKFKLLYESQIKMSAPGGKTGSQELWSDEDEQALVEQARICEEMIANSHTLQHGDRNCDHKEADENHTNCFDKNIVATTGGAWIPASSEPCDTVTVIQTGEPFSKRPCHNVREDVGIVNHPNGISTDINDDEFATSVAQVEFENKPKRFKKVQDHDTSSSLNNPCRSSHSSERNDGQQTDVKHDGCVNIKSSPETSCKKTNSSNTESITGPGVTVTNCVDTNCDSSEINCQNCNVESDRTGTKNTTHSTVSTTAAITKNTDLSQSNSDKYRELLSELDPNDDLYDELNAALNPSPLRKFRRGYLWVSDFTRQHWCEQQLFYTFTQPALVVEKPVMTEGTNLHLERELAVHDVVNVKVVTNEDIWAIKVLNMINSVKVFLNHGSVAREIPIFGAPFDEDVFVVGLIDELRFEPDSFRIELWELKTRLRKSMPSKSQKAQHRLQVMLYQKMFDDLVKGVLKKETVAKHLKLDLSVEFSTDIQQQIEDSHMTCKNLDELMGILFANMQCVTCIQGLGVEYVHQESKQVIGSDREVYDETELEAMYKDYLLWWRGDRTSRGVDIEEAWKCQSCDFADVCDWRRKKAEEYSKKNSLR